MRKTVCWFNGWGCSCSVLVPSMEMCSSENLFSAFKAIFWWSWSIEASMLAMWIISDKQPREWWQKIATQPQFFPWEKFSMKRLDHLFQLLWPQSSLSVDIPYLVEQIFKIFSLENKKFRSDSWKYFIGTTDIEKREWIFHDIAHLTSEQLLIICKGARMIPVVSTSPYQMIDSIKHGDTYHSNRSLAFYVHYLQEKLKEEWALDIKKIFEALLDQYQCIIFRPKYSWGRFAPRFDFYMDALLAVIGYRDLSFFSSHKSLLKLLQKYRPHFKKSVIFVEPDKYDKVGGLLDNRPETIKNNFTVGEKVCARNKDRILEFLSPNLVQI